MDLAEGESVVDSWTMAAEVPAVDEVPVMNLAQFARATGGVTTHDVDSHIMAGLRCAPRTKTYRRYYDRKLAELQEKRNATKAAYDLAIAEGRIRRPAPLTLEEKASGHPDNPSVQAAIRLLEKCRARQAQQDQQNQETSA